MYLGNGCGGFLLLWGSGLYFGAADEGAGWNAVLWKAVYIVGFVLGFIGKLDWLANRCLRCQWIGCV